MFYNVIDGVLVYDKARTVDFTRACEAAIRSGSRLTVAELAEQRENDLAIRAMLLPKKDSKNA